MGEQKVIDKEKTQYLNRNDESTQFDGEKSPAQSPTKSDESGKPRKRHSVIAHAGTGLGVGIIMGSVATLFAGNSVSTSEIHATSDNATLPEQEMPEVTTVETDQTEDAEDMELIVEQPAWSDGKILVATGVSDDMSFSEAFQTARQEVGPGGAFEWHGNVYATYTLEEWNGMTPSEIADYENHFSWNHHSSGTNGDNAEADDKEIEVIIDGDDDEVEVLGIGNDSEDTMNEVDFLVDAQDVAIYDVDDGLSFDIMGQLDDNYQEDDSGLYDDNGSYDF